MPADPANAALWADADVYVAPLGTTSPLTATDPFPAGWTMVGLLDGDEGFTESREEEEEDHFAWGGILVRTSRRNFKLQRTFTALEDNPTVRSLVYPGSTATSIVVPRPTPVLMAWEVREDDKIRRVITALHAECTVNGDITESESSLMAFPILATIFPDTATSPAVLFERQFDDGVA